MNKLNRKFEYALMTLQFFYENPNSKVSAKEVCEKTGSPFDATARVMQLMAHSNILKSVQGVNGGYVLAKDIQAITVLELMELVTGPVEVAKCVGTSADCELIGRCNIQTPVNKMNFKFREFLSNLKLTDFLISASQKMGV